jgi:hypothetical protein
MGTIRIGRIEKKPYNGGSITTSPEVAAPKQMSEEEKAAFMESVKKLPKDKWVSALRNAGLEEEANECEKALAEEHLHELNAKNRAKRLAEIQAMDDEEAQLQLLLDEGFTDEAGTLAEKLAAKAEEQGAGSDELDGKTSSTEAGDEGEQGGDAGEGSELPESTEPSEQPEEQSAEQSEEQSEAGTQDEKPSGTVSADATAKQSPTAKRGRNASKK